VGSDPNKSEGKSELRVRIDKRKNSGETIGYGSAITLLYEGDRQWDKYYYKLTLCDLYLPNNRVETTV